MREIEHWAFEPVRAAVPVRRVCEAVEGARRGSGKVRHAGVIDHLGWLPLQDNVVATTEQPILAHNPVRRMAGGCGVHPQWLTDVAESGYAEIESFSCDLSVPYTHESWRGRIRAIAGDTFPRSPSRFHTASSPSSAGQPPDVPSCLGRPLPRSEPIDSGSPLRTRADWRILYGDDRSVRGRKQDGEVRTNSLTTERTASCERVKQR